MTDDLYDTLGVPPDATPEDIKAAYRAEAKKHHPDAGGDAERFGELQKAYDVLSDEDKRRRYDQTGSTDTMDPAQRIEAIARDRFAALIVEIVQGDPQAAFTKDWIKHAKDQLHRSRAKAKAERKAVEGKIALADKLAARFKAKNTAKRNIPADVLSHVKRDMARNLAEIDEAFAIMDRLEAMLDDHTFEADPPTPGSPYAQGYGIADLMNQMSQQNRNRGSGFFRYDDP